MAVQDLVVHFHHMSPFLQMVKVIIFYNDNWLLSVGFYLFFISKSDNLTDEFGNIVHY